MKSSLVAIALVCLTQISYCRTTTFTIPSKEAHAIGQKIWWNECRKSIDGLTTWREGEDFASLGCLHMIWHPKQSDDTYTETFPSFAWFAKKHHHPLPPGILKNPNVVVNPWNSREEFNRDLTSPKMKKLRKFLVDTIDLQVKFATERLKKALTEMMKVAASAKERSQIFQQFKRLAHSPNGWYALIDYLNFKGEGTKGNELYNGHRWGLMQVLLTMQGKQQGSAALKDFAQAAKKVLKDRVMNAPASKQETEMQWLKGWYNRIDTYTA